MSKVVVGKCTVCGRELRVKAGAVKPFMHLTCKCGAKNEVQATNAVLEESRRLSSTIDNEVVRLVKGLDSKDPSVSGPEGHAAQRLIELGSAAVPFLVSVLKGERRGNRWVTALILGRIADKSSVVALVDVLKNSSEDEGVRAGAAEALGKSGSKAEDIVPALILALNDPRFPVRRAVVGALEDIGEDAKPAVPALLQALNDPDERIRKGVAYALSKIDPAARALHHADIEKVRGRDALDDNIEKLKHPDPNVRLLASRDMCEIPDFGDFYFRAVLPLIEALNDDQSEVRANAAHTLGKIRDKRATEALIQSLKDRDPGIEEAGGSVREYAAYALGEIGDNRATQPLIEALQSEEDWSARIEMIEALGKIGDPRAIPSLERIANTDKDSQIQATAREQLEKIEK